uniref:Ovule protein n=1 Tax=Heterorhabditis bacteriophora TaxID=37862 RepID=A0A1I7XJ52_HETBA
MKESQGQGKANDGCYKALMVEDTLRTSKNARQGERRRESCDELYIIYLEFRNKSSPQLQQQKSRY